MSTPAPARPPRPFDPEQAEDPIPLFRQWLAEATLTEPSDPNAMALATATPDAHPSVRMVLMKRLDDRGFTFYTNALSRKAAEFLANPHASACFHWKTQRRQIRIDGLIVPLRPEDADQYFHTRTRGSQIGAAASRQSQPLASRETLESAAHQIDLAHPGEIPRPPEWRGFTLQLQAIEFWQDGPDRLHDRMLYTRAETTWTRTRLYP
jgi:pyridoxamine 5'-phosphate oxidase